MAKRFEKRGLAIDSRAGKLSIPHELKPGRKRKTYLIGLVLLPVIGVPMFVTAPQMPIPMTSKEAPCELSVGDKLPPRVEVSRKVTLGGLSVMSVRCGSDRYSVTIDAKGEIVASKSL